MARFNGEIPIRRTWKSSRHILPIPEFAQDSSLWRSRRIIILLAFDAPLFLHKPQDDKLTEVEACRFGWHGILFSIDGDKDLQLEQPFSTLEVVIVIRKSGEMVGRDGV
jgi:hypothetical protein